MTAFWDKAQCSLMEMTDVSDVLTASIIKVMMGAISTSGKSVSFYQNWAQQPRRLPSS
jgi:S-formylglutathione hydrolase FrmB